MSELQINKNIDNKNIQNISELKYKYVRYKKDINKIIDK